MPASFSCFESFEAEILPTEFNSIPPWASIREIARNCLSTAAATALGADLVFSAATVTTRQATDHHPADDLVRRNFAAERQNELWVADIT
jgi:hypothetical protein